MWPFTKKKQPGKTRTPRYVHKSQVIPGLPSCSKGKRHLGKTLTALIKSGDFYRDQLELVRDAKQVTEDKLHQRFLIEYIREQRKLLDSVEACLMLALNDARHVNLSQPIRASAERILEEYLRKNG